MSRQGQRVAKLEAGRPPGAVATEAGAPAPEELSDAKEIIRRCVELHFKGPRLHGPEDKAFLAECAAGKSAWASEICERYDRAHGIDRSAANAVIRERVARLFGLPQRRAPDRS
jgi:hypothetical protein